MKLLLIAVLGSVTAMAQVPPPILRLVRNPTIDSAQPYANAAASVQVFGMRAVTGAGEKWLIEQHPNFASIEDLDRALGATGDPSHWVDPRSGAQDEVLGPGRTLIAVYREGWGFHSEDAIRMLPHARYFNITVYRLRPGADDDMEAFMRMRHHVLDSINISQPDLVYRVISGASSGLYLVLAPLVSLRQVDEQLSKISRQVELKQPAGEEGRESLLFRLDPSLSYVSDEFSAADTAFWRGR